MSLVRPACHYPLHVALPVTGLALAGVTDLLFERIIYRVGINVPKDPSALSVYRGATTFGDSAFRYAVVLAVFAAVATAFYLLRQCEAEQRLAGVTLLALGVLDTVTIRDNGAAFGMVVTATYAGALVLLLGVAIGGRLGWPVRTTSLTAGVALLAGQYPLVAARVGGLWQSTLPHVAAALTIAEASVVLTAVFLFVSAHPWDRPTGRCAIAAGAAVVTVVGVAWFRAPATVAILALWGTGVTMSFPVPVYLIALGAVVAAVITFASETATRHLAVAALLLVVAGVQPTVTQYNLAALLGVTILVLGSQSAGIARPATVSVGAAASNMVEGMSPAVGTTVQT